MDIADVEGLQRFSKPRLRYDDVSMTGGVTQPASGSGTQGNPGAQVSTATTRQAKTGDSQAATLFGSLLASLLLDAQAPASTPGQESATVRPTSQTPTSGS